MALDPWQAIDLLWMMKSTHDRSEGRKRWIPVVEKSAILFGFLCFFKFGMLVMMNSGRTIYVCNTIYDAYLYMDF